MDEEQAHAAPCGADHGGRALTSEELASLQRELSGYLPNGDRVIRLNVASIVGGPRVMSAYWTPVVNQFEVL